MKGETSRKSRVSCGQEGKGERRRHRVERETQMNSSSVHAGEEGRGSASESASLRSIEKEQPRNFENGTQSESPKGGSDEASSRRGDQKRKRFIIFKMLVITQDLKRVSASPRHARPSSRDRQRRKVGSGGAVVSDNKGKTRPAHGRISGNTQEGEKRKDRRTGKKQKKTRLTKNRKRARQRLCPLREVRGRGGSWGCVQTPPAEGLGAETV